jgi:hypothetical protein
VAGWVVISSDPPISIAQSHDGHDLLYLPFSTVRVALDPHKLQFFCKQRLVLFPDVIPSPLMQEFPDGGFAKEAGSHKFRPTWGVVLPGGFQKNPDHLM